MPESKKKETQKRQRPGKYARQFERTARNLKKRRARHLAKYPNDKAAVADWERSPITHGPR